MIVIAQSDSWFFLISDFFDAALAWLQPLAEAWFDVLGTFSLPAVDALPPLIDSWFRFFVLVVVWKMLSRLIGWVF